MTEGDQMASQDDAEQGSPESTPDLRSQLLETRRITNEKLDAARADNQVLRKKLLETRELLNGKVQAAREDNQLLRKKLVETRASLGSQLQAVREENQELRRKLATHERRHAMKDVDALAHNTQSSMEAYFADIPDDEPYVRFGAALRDELQRRGVALDGRSVLDAGVGPGIALHELLRNATPAAVTGFDFSTTALDNARRLLPDGRFERRSVYDPLEEQFDVVLCTEVLEHLERPAEALQNLARLTTPDGVLVLTVPDGRIDFSAKHINFWSPESWRIFLKTTLPEHQAETAVFAPTTETGHQNNLALVRSSRRGA
jgi:2-polyprenyl-3-methyl-5-hydroxy-6-metoxy-1,4-benzoquinol methylase